MEQKLKIEIKELRKRQGMTQKELAEKMQVSFQAVSKWENGVNMPDITHIPRLIDIFGVSADELLGLQPRKKQEWRKFDSNEYWNKNRKLFEVWKSLYWNDDYFSFLVSDVWKLNRPMDILDFGCGYGFLGMKFLPLLPEKSSYTGIELDSREIERAENIFKATPYEHRFIRQNIYEFHPQKKYDIVVALYLLSYVKHPQQILEKMKACLKPDGLLIVIDSNMAVEQAGFFAGLEQEENDFQRPDFTPVWENETFHRERDFRMGTRLPYLFKKCGMKNIEARISDRVMIYDSGDKENERFNHTFRYVYENEDSFQGGKDYFLTRGASYQRACEYVDYYKKIKNYFDSDDSFAVKTSGLYFVYAGL